MSKDKKFGIQNTNNYLKDFNHPLPIILKEYVNILKEYFNYFSCYIKKNDYEKLNIITKGLESISHIFTFIILYTKNLELAIFHTKKSYLYYFEFISQIGDESNSFLKLNCKDAILFIYKKTIFEIIKKDDIVFDKKNKFFCQILKKFTELTKNIYFYNIHHLINTSCSLEKHIIEDNIKKINESITKIIQIICKKYKEIDLFEKIFKLTYYFENIKLNPSDYIFILKSILKKKKILHNTIKYY